jgi:hypothetical protein
MRFDNSSASGWANSLPPQAGEGLGMRVGEYRPNWFQLAVPHPNPSDETTSHSTKHDKAVQVAGYPAYGRGTSGDLVPYFCGINSRAINDWFMERVP